MKRLSKPTILNIIQAYRMSPFLDIQKLAYLVSCLHAGIVEQKFVTVNVCWTLMDTVAISTSFNDKLVNKSQTCILCYKYFRSVCHSIDCYRGFLWDQSSTEPKDHETTIAMAHKCKVANEHETECEFGPVIQRCIPQDESQKLKTKAQRRLQHHKDQSPKLETFFNTEINSQYILSGHLLDLSASFVIAVFM